MDPVEARFLKDISERPDDSVARLIYADWLEEHGSLGRADFLRAQLRLTTLAPGDPSLAEVAKTLQSLLPETDAKWRTLVAQKPLENCTFVVQCTLRWEQLTPTKDRAIRHCDSCQKPVHYISTQEQLRRHGQAGDCVAVDLAVPRRPGDLSLEPDFSTIRAPGIVVPPPPFPQPIAPPVPPPAPPKAESPGLLARLRKLLGGKDRGA